MLDNVTENPSDLWRRWQEAAAQIGPIDEAAYQEAAGAAEARVLSDAQLEPIFGVMTEIEQAARGCVPSTLDGVLLRVRLLKANWELVPFELHDDLLDRALEGLEAMAAAGG